MPSDQHTGRAPIRVRIEAEAASVAPYDVLIGDGLIRDSGAFIAAVVPSHRYAIITDDNVEATYAAGVAESLAKVGATVDIHSFVAGEASKTRETWAEVTDGLLRAGHGRDSGIVIAGGGVAGDLGGFVAATFMRGVPFVNVPTTLLAMLDSSVGGKTGVDTAEGKNLVGSFHQPSLVLIDPAVLATLPEPAFRAGLAEAIKHGVIADATYLAWILENARSIVARSAETLTRLVQRSVEIKAAVVAEDTREIGKRAILNFGHTIGHAIERVTGFSVAHGFAVSIGMVAEARLGERLALTEQGTADRIAAALRAFDLPTESAGHLAVDALVEATRTDKKARASTVRYALPERAGSMYRDPSGAWTTAVDDATIRAVAEALSQARTEF